MAQVGQLKVASLEEAASYVLQQVMAYVQALQSRNHVKIGWREAGRRGRAELGGPEHVEPWTTHVPQTCKVV